MFHTRLLLKIHEHWGLAWFHGLGLLFHWKTTRLVQCKQPILKVHLISGCLASHLGTLFAFLEWHLKHPINHSIFFGNPLVVCPCKKLQTREKFDAYSFMTSKSETLIIYRWVKVQHLLQSCSHWFQPNMFQLEPNPTLFSPRSKILNKECLKSILSKNHQLKKTSNIKIF